MLAFRTLLDLMGENFGAEWFSFLVLPQTTFQNERALVLPPWGALLCAPGLVMSVSSYQTFIFTQLRNVGKIALASFSSTTKSVLSKLIFHATFILCQDFKIKKINKSKPLLPHGKNKSIHSISQSLREAMHHFFYISPRKPLLANIGYAISCTLGLSEEEKWKKREFWGERVTANKESGLASKWYALHNQTCGLILKKYLISVHICTPKHCCVP